MEEKKIEIKEQMIADTEQHISLIERDIKEADNIYLEITEKHHKEQDARKIKIKNLQEKLRRLKEGLIQVEEKLIRRMEDK